MAKETRFVLVAYHSIDHDMVVDEVTVDALEILPALTKLFYKYGTLARITVTMEED